jgi:hypothetical protein
MVLFTSGQLKGTSSCHVLVIRLPPKVGWSFNQSDGLSSFFKDVLKERFMRGFQKPPFLWRMDERCQVNLHNIVLVHPAPELSTLQRKEKMGIVKWRKSVVERDLVPSALFHINRWSIAVSSSVFPKKFFLRLYQCMSCLVGDV